MQSQRGQNFIYLSKYKYYPDTKLYIYIYKYIYIYINIYIYYVGNHLDVKFSNL